MKTLIFVYNAKSDFWNKNIDNIHKIISPNTYSCNLCNLTHGNFAEEKAWKDFRQNSDIEMEFMYKNKFCDKYPNLKELNLPVILQKEKDSVSVLFSSKKLASIKSTENLISMLQKEDLV